MAIIAPSFFYDRGEELLCEAFRREASPSPFPLLEELMDIPDLPMHSPPHHFYLPGVLLVCVGRAQDMTEEAFDPLLLEIRKRAERVPGGICGNYGACGAGVAVGLFMSVYTGTQPRSVSRYGDCNRATGRALERIGRLSGPRCCKRNCFNGLLSALETVEECFGVSLSRPEELLCRYYAQNPDCKGPDCPFFPG